MRESCAVVFKCGNHYFVVKRSESLSVFPGYYAFVGGKVDEGEDLLCSLKREVMEEVSFDLENVKSLTHLCYATTPDFNPYRFKTHFFLAQVDVRPNFKLLAAEIEKGEWYTKEEFLAAFSRGEILAVPPIVKLFQNNFITSFKDIVDATESDKIANIEPLKDIRIFYPYSNTFPPANRTNCFLIGSGNGKILVDPSPKNEEELEKLVTTLKEFSFSKIMLTHHHRDHNEFANVLAKKYNVPIFCSRDTKIRIEKKWDKNFFKSIETIEIKEGDVITDWVGEDVLALSVPGHDEGQIALYPKSKRWVLVGDLIQTIGTVVIGDDEGDMGKYYASLEKVIAMKPDVIFPSHGIALGGTQKLAMTLKHRKMREDQVNELFLKGHSEKEIVDILYAGIESRLHKYALKTIRAHLVHLGYLTKDV